MPATIEPASRTKIARSTSSPSPMAAAASRWICASRNSMSSGSGRSSMWKSTGIGRSDADHLLDQRDVVEVRPIRPDLPFSEVGHGDARQLHVRSRCLHFDILGEDQRAGVISFDQPFGIRLIAHFVQSSEKNDDVGECDLAEGGEGGEFREPRYSRIWRPTHDIVGKQGAQIK